MEHSILRYYKTRVEACTPHCLESRLRVFACTTPCIYSNIRASAANDGTIIVTVSNLWNYIGNSLGPLAPGIFFFFFSIKTSLQNLYYAY